MSDQTVQTHCWSYVSRVWHPNRGDLKSYPIASHTMMPVVMMMCLSTTLELELIGIRINQNWHSSLKSPNPVFGWQTQMSCSWVTWTFLTYSIGALIGSNIGPLWLLYSPTYSTVAQRTTQPWANPLLCCRFGLMCVRGILCILWWRDVQLI